MVERGIGQTDAVMAHLATKTLYDGLALGVYYLRRAFPVVDGKLAIVVLANQVDGTCNVQILIVNGPLLAIGLDIVVANKTQKVQLFLLYAYHFGIITKLQLALGLEETALKIVLCLLVYKGTHLAGHATCTLPLIQALLYGYAFKSQLVFGLWQGLEFIKEIGNERADRQHTLYTFIYIYVFARLKINVGILLVMACIAEGGHFFAHIIGFVEGLNLLFAVKLVGIKGISIGNPLFILAIHILPISHF